MTRGKKFRKSDMAILKDSLLESCRSLDRWLNRVEWDQLTCRLLGHRWHERRARNARTHAWEYVVSCRRCRRLAGFKASTWQPEDERAARRMA